MAGYRRAPFYDRLTDRLNYLAHTTMKNLGAKDPIRFMIQLEITPGSGEIYGPKQAYIYNDAYKVLADKLKELLGPRSEFDSEANKLYFNHAKWDESRLEKTVKKFKKFCESLHQLEATVSAVFSLAAIRANRGRELQYSLLQEPVTKNIFSFFGVNSNSSTQLLKREEACKFLDSRFARNHLTRP
jgi:hypothetical protein